MPLTDQQIDQRLRLDFDEEANKYSEMMNQILHMDLEKSVPFLKSIPALDMHACNAWNYTPYMNRYNNCTNFAWNRYTFDTLQPGQMADKKREKKNKDPKALLEALKHDRVRPIDDFMACNQNEYPVALFHNKVLGDFHWYGLRQAYDTKGTLRLVWASKRGKMYASLATDNDIFSDIQQVKFYKEFLGYYAVPQDLTSPPTEEEQKLANLVAPY